MKKYLLKTFRVLTSALLPNKTRIVLSEATTESQLYFSLGADNCCQVCREREEANIVIHSRTNAEYD